ncbi:class I SAM-dependent methyltransferase [Taibaiella lutea]|uniref:Class I SAM-dependent methyltransferase n=1 Tax=Taibaiella lutea TaxID=2608001 RepID=A0A5M6CU23_9BACT|nr:class I SAM-dependent methyltransferase [Taibaiella lutea]KAA5536505.1 class I SAM-dependent methyltransferase [Taibaiella lutea]
MKDILGNAIMDYYNFERNHILWVHDHHGPKVEMPVKTYFRKESEMPELELKAISLCKGKILDIGAGAGSHTLALEDREMDVRAIDISPQLISVMEMRGVTKFIQQDIFKFKDGKFDTLLLLMNGIGLVGNIEGLRRFLNHCKTLLNPGGQLIFDSSDVAYLYEDDIPVMDNYYGEIECRYEYRRQKTDWFSWLYIDRNTLQLIAEDEGWKMEFVMEDESGQYLVRLSVN